VIVVVEEIMVVVIVKSVGFVVSIKSVAFVVALESVSSVVVSLEVNVEAVVMLDGLLVESDGSVVSIVCECTLHV
jgi:hypothetical protein